MTSLDTKTALRIARQLHQATALRSFDEPRVDSGEQFKSRYRPTNWFGRVQTSSGRRGDSRLNTDQPIARLTSALRTIIPIR